MDAGEPVTTTRVITGLRAADERGALEAVAGRAAAELGLDPAAPREALLARERPGSARVWRSSPPARRARSRQPIETWGHRRAAGGITPSGKRDPRKAGASVTRRARRGEGGRSRPLPP